MINIEALQASYSKAEKKINGTLCQSAKVHPGMYCVSDSTGKLWKVYKLEDGLTGWIAVEWHSDYGSYSDPMPTKKDVLESLGF